MKKSYLTQSLTELTVGFFVFAILGALILFTIILSYDNVFTKSFRMDVKFDNVTGLIRGDKVYVQGVDIGRVNELSIQPDGVLVNLTLKYDVRLRKDYEIMVKPSSVLGGKYVSIHEGSREMPDLEPGTVIVGRAPVDFLEEASEALASIRSVLDEGGAMQNLSDTLANLKTITDGLVEGKGTVGKLLVEDQLYNDLKQVAADLKDVSGRLSRGEGTMGKLLSSDETVYNDLKSTIASINDTMAKVSRGEGTLGKLVNDQALYDEIMKSLAEVRAMFDDLRETSPVTTMTGVFFGSF